MPESSLVVCVYTSDKGHHHVQLVKVDGNGEFLDYFLINNSLPTRAVQEAFASDLAKWLHVRMATMVKVGDDHVYQIQNKIRITAFERLY